MKLTAYLRPLALISLLSLSTMPIALTTVACAHAPANTTPQAAVAHYGTDLINGVNAVRQAVIAATDATPPILTAEKATPVMDNLRKANTYAQDLSGLLKMYDAATTVTAKADLSVKIQSVLSAITAAVGMASGNDMPSQLLSQTTSLVANVNTTVNLIRSALVL